MSHRLLLDAMFTPEIAEQLQVRGHDVQAAVADPLLNALPDDELLATAAGSGRALVTANIKDVAPLGQLYQARGHAHAGMVLVSSKTFPQDRALVGALVGALDGLLRGRRLRADVIVFLAR